MFSLETVISCVRGVVGERTISMTNANYRLSFKIYINGNYITSAYDAGYIVYTGQITSSNLALESNVQATYYVTYKPYAGISLNKYLRVNMDDGSIQVTFN